MANILANSQQTPCETDTRVSKETIVQVVAEKMQRSFGKSAMALLELHLPQYAISFGDTSIVDEPERFTEAMFYTFGSAAEFLFDSISAELMLYAPIDPLDDLTTSGSAGFVFLIYKIRKMYAL